MAAAMDDVLSSGPKEVRPPSPLTGHAVSIAVNMQKQTAQRNYKYKQRYS